MSDEKELCGVPHPWLPHRTCLREKGHSDDTVTSGFLVPKISSHTDYAGSWLLTRKGRKERDGG